MACSCKRSYKDAKNEDQQVSIHDVGEMLSSYDINVFDSNLNTVKIQQDQFRCHKTFKQREEDTQINNIDQDSNNDDQITAQKISKKKRGPRATKIATKCQARSQARYKRRKGIIKAIRDLKVITGDDSLISFFKHPVDGSTDERMIYGATQELISKFKSFGLEDFSVESTSESLFPSEIGSKEKVCKKEKESQNYCCICNLKCDTKLDNNFDSPWIGCNVKSCNYWVHAFCLGFVVDEPSELPDFFCRKHHPTKCHHIEQLLRKSIDKTFVMNRG